MMTSGESILLTWVERTLCKCISGNVDMSKIENTDQRRVDCQDGLFKTCIDYLPKTNFKGYESADKMVAFTRWWLISAEPVDFGKEDAKGWGIPNNLIGADTKWVTAKANHKVSGKGYLYVIVDVNGKKVTWDGFGRRRVDCTKMYVCQVTEAGTPHLAVATVKSGKAKWRCSNEY
jgi:hypothetical protein